MSRGPGALQRAMLVRLSRATRPVRTSQLAYDLGRGVRQVERSTASLRRAGLIETRHRGSHPVTWDEHELTDAGKLRAITADGATADAAAELERS